MSMAKEVTHTVEFRDPVQPDIGPDRQLLVLACDDGSLYEFQKYPDEPKWVMRRRGERGAQAHEWTQRRARLPGDVEDTLDDVAGKGQWSG